MEHSPPDDHGDGRGGNDDDAERIEAALDAALDELDDDNDIQRYQRTAVPNPLLNPTTPETTNAGQSLSLESQQQRRHHDQSTEKTKGTTKGVMAGPPRPPPSPSVGSTPSSDPDAFLNELMTSLLAASSSTSSRGQDVDAELLLKHMMEEFQQIQYQEGTASKKKSTNSIPSSGKPSPNKPAKSSQASSKSTDKKASTKSTTAVRETTEPSPRHDKSIDETISQLVEEMSKPIHLGRNHDGQVMTDGDDTDEMFHSFMKDFSTNGADQFHPDSVIEGMMQELLSKEFMYEPMKEVASKFPEWLRQNQATLSTAEYEK